MGYRIVSEEHGIRAGDEGGTDKFLMREGLDDFAGDEIEELGAG